jgi:hypothetical protein
MPVAYHKDDWHKLTAKQCARGKAEGEFLIFPQHVDTPHGPGTWLKATLRRILPARWGNCAACAKRAAFMDRAWVRLTSKFRDW